MFSLTNVLQHLNQEGGDYYELGQNETKLKEYCFRNNVHPPEYRVIKSKNGFDAIVNYHLGVAGTNSSQPTEHMAKEEAALMALANIGPDIDKKPEPEVKVDVSWKRKHQEQQQQQGAVPTNTQAAHGGAGPSGTSQKKPKHNLPEYRTILYKYCDKQAMPTPLYETTNDGSGFSSLVTVFIPSSGTSPNKKASEQSAAYMALFFLKQLEKESWMDEVNAAGMPIDKDSPANEINDKKCVKSIAAQDNNVKLENFKGALNEFLVRHKLVFPSYETVQEGRRFNTTCALKFPSQKASKKKATSQHNAARYALDYLRPEEEFDEERYWF